MSFVDVDISQPKMFLFNQPLFVEKACVADRILLHCTRELGLSKLDFYVTSNGKIITNDTILKPGSICHVVPRLVGGKGGFGSMLRAIGAQIEKTTSREACRDLSGRRMRDVNNEKQLREWVGKQADREREKEERRQARIEKRRAIPNHKFEDATYEEQKQKVAEGLEDALAQGLHKTLEPGPSGSGLKRKAEASVTKSKKQKQTEWLGVDIDLSDSEADSDLESENGVESTTEGKEGQPTDQSDDSYHAKENENNICPILTDTNKDEQDGAINIACEDRSDIKSHCESNNMNQQVCSDSSLSSDDSDEKSTSSKSNICNKADEENQHLANVPLMVSAVISAEKSTVENKLSEEPIDLESFSSLKELLPLGLDSLKRELSLRGLKCGGNLEQRAERLWAVKGLKASQYPSSLLAKPGKVKNK